MNRSSRHSAVIIAIGCLVLLVGCGGSSGSKSAGRASTTGTAATSSTTPSTAGASPTATSGNTPSVEAPPSSSSARTKTPALHRALTKFVACLRENGVKIAPNTSGKSPLLSLKGVDTTSPQFRAADKKCVATLRATLKSTTASKQPPSGKTPVAPPIKRKVNVPPKIAHAFEHFTACMREHGITNFPEPEGASFNTTHIDLNQHSPQLKAAESKCNPILNAVL
jgi:hypothetical protein